MVFLTIMTFTDQASDVAASSSQLLVGADLMCVKYFVLQDYLRSILADETAVLKEEETIARRLRLAPGETYATDVSNQFTSNVQLYFARNVC